MNREGGHSAGVCGVVLDELARAHVPQLQTSVSTASRNCVTVRQILHLMHHTEGEGGREEVRTQSVAAGDAERTLMNLLCVVVKGVHALVGGYIPHLDEFVIST